MIPFTAGRRAYLVALTLAIVACGPSNAQQGRGFYTSPAPGTFHPVPAEHGMVVAQEKLAAQIGADILRQGGNAVDAAVATGFAMAVTYPRAGNIGGGGFIGVYFTEGNEDITIDYRETAPAATTPQIFLRADRQPHAAEAREFPPRGGGPRTVAGLLLGP